MKTPGRKKLHTKYKDEYLIRCPKCGQHRYLQTGNIKKANAICFHCGKKITVYRKSEGVVNVTKKLEVEYV